MQHILQVSITISSPTNTLQCFLFSYIVYLSTSSSKRSWQVSYLSHTCLFLVVLYSFPHLDLYLLRDIGWKYSEPNWFDFCPLPWQPISIGLVFVLSLGRLSSAYILLYHSGQVTILFPSDSSTTTMLFSVYHVPSALTKSHSTTSLTRSQRCDAA